jgi:uncharacterized radical SAM superfamily Fe-S cluster-containing enzyme
VLYFMNQHGVIKKTMVSDIKYQGIDFTKWFCPIHRHNYIARHEGTLKTGVCGEIKIATPNRPWWNLEQLVIDNLDDGDEYYCRFKRGSCSCGSDLMVPKAKKRHIYFAFLEQFRVTDFNNVPEGIAPDDEIHAIGTPLFLKNNHFELHLDWGKKCNFDCSYCPPTIHDNFSPFTSLERVRHLFKLMDLESRVGEKVLIVTGGEPTLGKDLKDLVIMAQEEFGFTDVRINTNGTGNKKLYHWLCDRGCRLDVTFHPEFTTRKIAQKIFEVKRDLVDKQHELGLLVKPKVMGDPDSEFAHEIIEMITEVVGPGWEGHIEIVPIYIRGINKIENSIDRVKRARPHVKDYDPIDEDE